MTGGKVTFHIPSVDCAPSAVLVQAADYVNK